MSLQNLQGHSAVGVMDAVLQTNSKWQQESEQHQHWMVEL
jgi:hypothetical protein